MFCRCSRSDSASACAAAIFCCASILTRSRSRLALSAICSAVCLFSIAWVNWALNLKFTMETSTTAML